MLVPGIEVIVGTFICVLEAGVGGWADGFGSSCCGLLINDRNDERCCGRPPAAGPGEGSGLSLDDGGCTFVKGITVGLGRGLAMGVSAGCCWPGLP